MPPGDNFPQPADEPSENPLEQTLGSLSFCSSCGSAWEAGQTHCSSCGYEYAGPLAAAYGSPSESAAAGGRVNHKMGDVPWGIRHIIGGIILVMASLLSAAAAALVVGNLYPEQEDAVATWISVHLMGLSIVGTVWYLGLRHSRFPLAVLRLSRVRRPRKRTVLLMFGVLATSLIATSIYSSIVAWLELDELATPVVESDVFFDGFAVLLTFQALAFITPMSEELFFRGFIFRGLIPRLGPLGAMLVSAAVFSGFHLSVGVLIPIFITGFLFAWLYWRTGSLWASIGAHAGQNTLALLAQGLS